MKKFLFFFAMLFAASLLSAQTIVFRENFDPTSNADSVSASGALNNFAINTRLFHSGTQCDSTLVSPNGTAYLSTNSFSTVGFGYVFLNFSHICKIELLDSAKIEVSIDNGVTWTKLTGAQYVNPGNSQFVTLGNIFNSLAYPDWLATTGTAKPTNSWWKDESFDISALVSNQPNVRIRFSLKDGNGNGAFFNHGWYIDDIKVTAAISELSPPNITMKPPVLQDTIFNTGPFDIYAWITDASGIDTAYIDYQVNGGAHLYIPMLWVSDSTYKGTIPSYTFNNQIDYHVYAADNSTAHNSANGPNHWFYIKKGPNIVQIGTGTVVNSVTTYPTPYGQYYGSDHEQYLLLASELNAAGLMPGQLTSLAFDLQTGYTYADLENFQMNLANTNAATMATLITTGFTQVYGPVTYTPPSSTGWATINFTTPFVWDGVSNIVVDVSFSNCSVCNGTTSCTTSYTDNGIVNQSNTSFVSTLDYHYDNNCTINTFFPQQTYITASYSQRPNMKIGSPSYNFTEDAGVKQILTPTGTIVAGVNSPVTLLIKNYGLDTLKKVNIAWKLDGVLQTPYAWTGSLAEAITSGIINVGNVNVGVGPHIIKAWTEMPNDSVDQNSFNDTSSMSFYACTSILNGNYTIGPSGNYPTFVAALTALSNCGISGPVIFNVASGTYNERLDMPVINGISATNTVTFQSATGNYTDVTIQDSTTSSSNNFIIRLNGSSYLIFKNMTLKALGTSFGTVVYYSGNSTYNTFMGNKLVGIITTTSTSTDLAVVYSPSGSTAPDSVMTFDGNIVENGSYGFYLYGQGSSIGQLENKTIIRNNHLTNQYYCGIYLYYQNAPELVSNIISTNSGNAGFYAIQTSYCQNNMRILKNKITLTSGGYGAYLYYCTGILGSEGLTANNAISIGGVNAAYGIYTYYSSFQNIYYNSVNIYSNNASSTALYLNGYTANVNHKIKNNVLVYTGTNASGMAIYVATSLMVSSSNYNDLFSIGTNLGYWTTNCINLAALRTASTQDSNSVSVNPTFFSPTDLHTLLSDLNGKATPISGITDDIDGNPRSATNPDIGAYEFTPPPKNIGVVAVLQPTSSCSHTGADNVVVRLKNFGSANIDSADVYYRINGGTVVHELMIHTILPDSSYNYTFATQANLLAAGNYTFKVYAHLNGDTIHSNDTIQNYTIYSGYNFLSGPYTQSFESTEYFGDWSTLDVNADNYGWTLPIVGNAHTGNNSVQLYNGGTNTGNDWLFSRCFNMNAGSTYKIDFWYKASDASNPQNVDLFVGNNNTVAAMTTTLSTLTSFTNTTYQKATVNFNPTTSGTYYFGWWGHSVPNYYYAYIDDINITLLPPQEATLVSIISPNTGCGLTSNEIITIKIQNTGGDTINGNIMAYYKINSGATISQAVTNQLLPNDTLWVSFTQTANFSATATDQTYNLLAWISLPGDPLTYNDSINKQVISLHAPQNPVVANQTIPWGTSAILHATAPDSVFWFNAPVGGIQLGAGYNYTTPILYVNTVYYAQSFTPGGTTNWNFNSGLQGWTVQNPCTSGYNWAWDADGGNGALFASDPPTTSSQLITSPSVMIAGNSSITLSFDHHYATENCCDEGYVAYRLDGGPWIQFTPTVNTYNTGTHNIDNDPLNACISDTKSCFYGTQSTMITSSGTINTGGATNIELAFIFTSDGSVSSTGWYINDVTLSGGLGGCPSARIPDSVNVILFPYEAWLVSVTAPVDACTSGPEHVTIRVRNDGSNTINNMLANYSINGSSLVTETITTPILPGDTLTYTFLTTFNPGLTSAHADSIYNILVYIELAGDPVQFNDTLHKQVELFYTPPVPFVTNVTIPYATTATIHAVSADSINWFDVPSGGVALSNNSTFTTPVLYNTTIYYAEAVASGGSTAWTFDSGLDGWSVQNPCTSTTNWVWDADGGAGALFAADPGSSTGQLIESPVTSLTNLPAVNLTFKHRYSTESCCDEGYVAYKLDNGPWVQFTPTTNGYTSTTNTVSPDALEACGSITKPTFQGAHLTYYTSSGLINTVGASTIQLAFVFNSDGSVSGIGWYIDSVAIIGAGPGCASARVPDTVIVTGVPPCDVSVQTIHTPNSGILLTTSEIVSVRIKNYGTAAATNIPIHYKLDNNTPVDEVILNSIPSGDTLFYQFTAPVDLSNLGNYHLKVYTDLSCDNTVVNDTAYKVITCSPLVYCTSIPTSINDEEIVSVTLNGSTNTSNCTTIAPGPGSILNRYSNFATLPPLTTLSMGVATPFSVVQDQCNGSATYYNGIGIWIDLNRDGDFTDPGEALFIEPTTVLGPRTLIGTITVPPGAFSGVTTMRIICAEGSAGASLQPCMTYYYGETEDYSVRIAPPIPHDAGVISFIQPTTLVNGEGVSLPVQMVVKNFGLDTIYNSSNMTVAYSYNGVPQSIIWNGGNIAPLASDTAIMPNFTVVPSALSLCGWTVLAGDSNTFNDTTCLTIIGIAHQDAGVDSIISPLGQAPVGSHKVIKVKIHNFGSDTLYSIPVSFKTNNGTPTTETWTGILLPNGVVYYQFTAQVTVLSGAFSLCSYTGLLPLDQDHLNDTTCETFTGIQTFIIPYSDDFEGTVYFFTTGTLWQYGVPSSTTINTAYSPTHAWKTNISGNYTDNADDYLYTPFLNFTTTDSSYLDFYHWYDTQSGSDGCNVQYSVDGGSVWHILGLANDPAALNWYNATINGNPYWSGSSVGYIHSRFNLTTITQINNATVPVQFRFHFFSDGTTSNYDGWAVDNFQIVAPPIPNDIGVDSILLPNAATQTGAPVTVQVRIHNFGTNTITSFPVRYVVNSNPVVNEICTISLLPNASTNYTFTTTFNSPGSPYTVCAFTHLTGDTYYWNDSTCASYGVTPGLNDVGVIHILTPTDSTISGNSYTVSVTIKNFGLNTQTTIPVKYFRNSVLAGAGNWNGTLLFGDTAVYNVLIPFTSPLTLYSLCATTVLVGDVNLLNDTTCKSVYGYVGIDSYDFNSFQLMQNIPNPSNNHTSIAFYVPSDDKVRFDLVDLLGKSVLTKEMDAVVGKNELDLDVNNLGEGIYFYSVSYKGQKLTKRMVITK